MVRSGVAAALLLPSLYASVIIEAAPPARRVRGAQARSAVGRCVQNTGYSADAVEPGILPPPADGGEQLDTHPEAPPPNHPASAGVNLRPALSGPPLAPAAAAFVPAATIGPAPPRGPPLI